MNKSSIQKEPLFKETIKLTNITEYGYPWTDLMGRKKPIPAEGLRYDIYFEGNIFGSDINGTIKGVDYLTVRSDGRFFLTLHAEINTVDGARISVTETGINSDGILRLNMDFHTNDERYVWLNQIHAWGEGEVDFSIGQVTIQGFSNN